MNFIYLQIVLQVMIYLISLILIMFIITYIVNKKRKYLEALKEKKEQDREKESLLDSDFELV